MRLQRYNGTRFYENKWKLPERTLIDIHNTKYTFLKSNSTLNPLELSIDDGEILILGDSFVAGEACAYNDENFPGHLSQ